MRKQVIFLILVFGVLIGGILAYLKYFTREEKQNFLTQDKQLPTPKLKTFKSTNLDFTVQIPERYNVTEKWVTVEFNSDNGSIGINRNDASVFNNLEDYLSDFDEKNQIGRILETKELNVNNYHTIVRVEERGGTLSRLYYIYTNGWVYIFSTDSESLYPDLDQIAKSFRYTP